ncbi:hypothetical protein JCM6882_007183 [Rhodosporidiobolus microsporus]
METATSTAYAPTSAFREPPAALRPSSQTPRSLPSSAELVKDALNAYKLQRAASPMLSVSAEYDADTSDGEVDPLSRTLTSKATLAPGPTAASRTHSPSPLLWSESGWNAGHFTFSPFDAPVKAMAEHGAANGTRTSSTSVGRLAGANGQEFVFNELSAAAEASAAAASTSAASSSPILRSKLAPTAQSFVPKVTSSTPAHLSYLDTSSLPYSRAGPDSGPSSSPSSSPLEPCTPPPVSRAAFEAQFDEHGHLITHGSKYTIADEILQLQGGHLGAHPDELETLAPGAVEPFSGPGAGGRSRTVSQGSTFTRGIEQWRMQHAPPPLAPAPSTFPLRQGSFPPGPSSAHGSFERSRSSSIASTASSYFGGAPRPALERAATAAQLQSYFGPPSAAADAMTAPVVLPGGFDTFDPTYPSLPPHHLSRTSSFSSLGGGAAGGAGAAMYPPLAHPEPFNLMPEDPLYQQARDVFIDSSCSSLSGGPTAQHRQSMGVHFDRSMHTLNPLATLFGLSQEAANQLLAEPGSSGVNDVVLKVAAMRGRQQQMASVQRSAMGAALPGPSPNNRKLNLYKTELCRSWEEKGSCRYGVKCQFAHGIHELREVARHPKFKSEICRTFWQQGSCPYGKRCCFIHASGDAALDLPLSSPTKSSGPNSRAESPVEHTTSRLNTRMTSTAITSAPSRTFGPAISELISSSSSSSANSSLQSSPRQSMRPDLAPIPAPAPQAEQSALFGLGISQRPGQAPPTYREAPQSRLHRLTSLSGASGCSTPSTIMTPVLPPATTTASFHPHSRQDSGNSFVTSSSATSSTGPNYSPLLARHGSSSSLSSASGSPVMLRPLGGEWLGSAAGGNALCAAQSSALEWPQEMEHLSLDELPPPASASVAGNPFLA